MTRAPKRPRDPNQLAKFIVDVASGEINTTASSTEMRARKAGTKGGPRAHARATLGDCPRSRFSSVEKALSGIIVLNAFGDFISSTSKHRLFGGVGRIVMVDFHSEREAIVRNLETFALNAFFNLAPRRDVNICPFEQG
jgi:hypothetical protein